VTGFAALYPPFVLRLTKHGFDPITVKQTNHYKLMRELCGDPAGFVQAALK
jgi:hypothetical protein